MRAMTRRAYLKQLGLAGAATILPTRSIFAKEPEPTESESAALEEIALKLMEKYHAPGLSVAIARQGQMVYQQAFGLANKATGEWTTPKSLFRIASVSKPITSV